MISINLDTQSQFFKHINEANTTEVQKLLEKQAGGIDVDALMEMSGCSALHVAATQDNEELAQLLLNHGASPDIPSKDRFTPLLFCAATNSTKVALALLAKGANSEIPGPMGDTPLFHASATGAENVADALLQNGANVNAHCGEDRLTPLHIAIEEGHLGLADLLLRFAADPNAQNKEGQTPMHLAALNAEDHLIRRLHFEGGDIEALDLESDTPLHLAILGKYPEGNTEALLELGANPNVEESSGISPLHIAARIGNLKAVELLISKEADPEKRDIAGNTPLHYAANQGHKEVIKYLAERTSSIDVKNSHGETPLMQSVVKGHSLIGFFKNLGADLNAVDYLGYSILDCAISQDHPIPELALRVLGAKENWTSALPESCGSSAGGASGGM